MAGLSQALRQAQIEFPLGGGEERPGKIDPHRGTPALAAMPDILGRARAAGSVFRRRERVTLKLAPGVECAASDEARAGAFFAAAQASMIRSSSTRIAAFSVKRLKDRLSGVAGAQKRVPKTVRALRAPRSRAAARPWGLPTRAMIGLS
jgi:hypothetical protein